MKINGRDYPLWGALVENKSEWIGGKLTEDDSDCGVSVTTIKDLRLDPYGDGGALFSVDGVDWGCCVNVKYGGIAFRDGKLNIHGYSQNWVLERPHETTKTTQETL